MPDVMPDDDPDIGILSSNFNFPDENGEPEVGDMIQNSHEHTHDLRSANYCAYVEEAFGLRYCDCSQCTCKNRFTIAEVTPSAPHVVKKLQGILALSKWTVKAKKPWPITVDMVAF